MKRVLAVIGETILFVLTGLIFMFWRPFHVTHQLASQGNEVRSFQADWIIGIALVAVAVAVIQLMFKRLRSGYPQLLIALAIAVAIGFAMKFGFTSATMQFLY